MKRATVLLLLLLFACDRSSDATAGPAPTPEPAAKASNPADSAELEADPDPEPDSQDPAPDADPLPDDEPDDDIPGPADDASPQQRREAVLALLVGGEQAKNLPVVSTDEGKNFNPGLVQRMAPRALPKVSPVVRLGKPTVAGDLSPEVVRRVARRDLAKLRKCYGRFLSSDPGLAGDLQIAFGIEANGKVTKASQVEQDLGNEAVGQCMASRANVWKFPKPGDGKRVTVTLPINVSAG